MVFVRDEKPGEYDFFEASVTDLDPTRPTWTLEDDAGGVNRLGLDLSAIQPGRPGPNYVGDTEQWVDSPDWIAYYDRIAATGQLVPAALPAHPLVGQTVIVGLTRVDPVGEVESLTQWFGTIVEVTDQGVGINVAGDLRLLPPDPLAFRGAAPGEYRLRSTGEVVTDPDLLSTWTHQRGAGGSHTDLSWARDWRAPGEGD